MNRRFDHIIFDLDGTLIDSAPAILASFSEVLAARGITPLVKIDNSLIGPPLVATLGRLSGVAEKADLDTLAGDFKRLYDEEGLRHTRLYPGIEEQLQRLSESGHRLHIATNKRQHPTSLILENLGMVGRFDTVYANDRITPAYASKAALLAAQLRDLGLVPGRTCYVGDRGDDARAAQANHLAFCFVAWGYPEAADVLAASDWTTVREMGKLADVLSGHAGWEA